MISTISSVPVDTSTSAARTMPSAQPVVASTVSTQNDETEQDLNSVQFFSPVVRLDVDTYTAVLQYRDPSSGETTKQYPSDKQIEAYQASKAEEAANTSKAAAVPAAKADGQFAAVTAQEPKIAVSVSA